MMLFAMRKLACLVTLWLLLGFQVSAYAAPDARMLVEVSAEQQQVELNWLHTHIKRASSMALQQLWNRIIPQSAHASIPRHVKAIRFLEKAIPTEQGMNILFHRKRVFEYLKAQHIPYIAEQPSLNLNIQLYDEGGRRMNQMAAELTDYAEEMAAFWGYRLDPQATPLVLLWRWMDHRQVSLDMRGGNADATPGYDLRRISSRDPLAALKPWLSEILVKTRDAHVVTAVEESAPVEPAAMQVLDGVSMQSPVFQSGLSKPPSKGLSMGLPTELSMPQGLLLTVQRQAALPEQVLFEDDLRHDSHVRSLLLKRVNRASQQYRLKLKGGDSQWLVQWFSDRGMHLRATEEGWVAIGE